MSRFSSTLAAVIALLAVQAAFAADDLARLSWLTGCWSSETGEPGSGEQWTALAGGTMFGIGRTIKQGKTVDHEFLELREDADGRVVFVAHPSRQKTARFPAIRLADGEVVFENVQHDFPQRVIYRLDGPDTLRARIEGMRNGTLRGVDFPMKRVSCDTSPK
jgi:hypothetical protein